MKNKLAIYAVVCTLLLLAAVTLLGMRYREDHSLLSQAMREFRGWSGEYSRYEWLESYEKGTIPKEYYPLAKEKVSQSNSSRSAPMNQKTGMSVYQMVYYEAKSGVLCVLFQFEEMAVLNYKGSVFLQNKNDISRLRQLLDDVTNDLSPDNTGSSEEKADDGEGQSGPKGEDTTEAS